MTTSGKKRIFISYRRADSAGYAGRIYDRLTAHFGVDAVFMDVDTIEAGLDFVDVLQNAVQSCDVLVALMGRRWLDSKDADGKRRLDNPEDFVRIEVAAALERDIRVIPVLVDGVSMPSTTELPENLKLLARRNALQVNHHSFNADTRRLISQLELALKAAENSRILKAQKLREEKERKEKETAAKAKAEKRARLVAEQKAEKEREEKARKEKETLEKAEAEERARFAKELQAKKEREEQERKVAVERDVKERKESVENAKEEGVAQTVASSISQVYKSGKTKGNIPTWLPYGFGGGVILIIAIILSLGPLIRNSNTPTVTAIPTVTPPTNPAVGSNWYQTIDGMTMVYVSAGESWMGSEGGDDDEKPIHNVYLDAFWIDQTEVTNEMFSTFLNSEGNRREGGVKWLDTSSENVLIHKVGDNWQADSGYENHPVIEVSWYGAQAYCEWVGRRLPTEAEWEKAASWDEESQQQRVYPWGNDFDCKKGNFDDDTQIDEYIVPGGENCDGYSQLAPVGSFSIGASFYDAFDMAGNAWEWVADWYDANYYSGSPKNNPKGPPSGYSRVIRSGGFGYSDDGLRSADRYGVDPTTTGSGIGFRCARDEKPQEEALAAANTPEGRGEALVTQYGCLACHTVDGSPGVGPTWLGVVGRQEEMMDGTIVTVDGEYIIESIMYPQEKMVSGYASNIMPIYEISDEQLADIIAYLETLK